ncbi:S100P-binding protein-like [Triplophysa rosa]|nr:S100P-binding protein-like [Triplophysa rosa]
MRIMSDGDNYTSSGFQHLKPLSVYSHMVCHEQYGASSPLCNMQITNKTAGKRRLDDSCLDETCETPLKKPRLCKSCSPDQGCVVDSSGFLTGVYGSTPTQTKDVTPQRSKVIPPVAPFMSTPVSQCTGNRFVQARANLPSPIPVLNWDRDMPSISLPASLNVESCNSINVSLTGRQGDGKGEVREVSRGRIPVRESKCRHVNPERVAAEPAVEVKEEGVSESQLTESKLDVTSQNDESFESSLPLRVQVKSKVVVPETTKTVCQSAATQSERKPDCDVYRRARYPVQGSVPYRGEDWKRAKKAYVESVMRHMETNGARDGVMTELHHLMNTVAGQRHHQRSGCDGGHWQHPSDLTQRNYRVRGPLLSLSEWQKRNQLCLRRFAKVPDIFHRSPVV